MERKELINLSIFELRDLARKVGVFSPTILKKNDLIQAICDIQDGKKKPHIAKTKQGRPPKEIGGYDKLVGIFLPKDILEIKTQEEYLFEQKDKEEELRFCDNPSVPDGTRGDHVSSGYLEILMTTSGLLRKKITKGENMTDTTFVHAKTIQQYGLRGGDHVLCLSSKVADDRPLVLTHITNINGVPIENYSLDRLNYDDLKFNPNASTIKFDTEYLSGLTKKLKLYYGDTVFCYPDSVDDFNLFVSQLNKEACFDSFVYISPATTNKDYEIIKSIKADLFCADFCDYNSVQKRASLLGLNRAKRLAEQGKNVCLIINDLNGLVNLDKGFGSEMPVAKSIISQAKNLDNGSITIFCNFPKIFFERITDIVWSTFPAIETARIVLKDKKIVLENSYRR